MFIILQCVCLEPSLEKVDRNKPKLIINSNASASDGTMSDSTFTIYLPAISLENGPFRLVYSKVALYIRDHGGLDYSGQKYHPKTIFTIPSWCLDSIG